MFCPYKYDQKLQLISNIITKNELKKMATFDTLHVTIRKKKQNKEQEHAVPCTPVGHVFIVSASET